MGQSPFAKRGASPDFAGPSRRRSTRVDYVCPIVVSGRDATGQSFREETESSTVNLHGCKLRTHHQMLVGMMLSIECPATKVSAKGVCVRLFDPQPGETAHEIAVQLVKPQNMWGVQNPPPDWEAVAEELVRGKGAPAERAAAAGPPSPPVPASPLGRVEAVAPPRPLDAEMQLAILERRVAQLTESVLQTLRTQADEFVRDTVDTFRQQVEALVKEAQAQIQERAEKAYADVEASLMTLRGDLAEYFSQRTGQIVAEAEEALRAKVGEILTSMLKPSPKK
jgi:ElaB/YqjD/DUF883 family membrane-anchored ribosome-binding protein